MALLPHRQKFLAGIQAWSERPWSVLLPIFALFLYRLLTLYANELPLYGDEAQYWVWSRDLAFGYFSKPPLVGWAIAATTAVCGNGESCVRLASPFAYSVGAVFVFLLGWRMFSVSIGFWSALIFLTLPGISFSSQLISTDPLLLMSWAIGLYCYYQADRLTQETDGQRRAWPWWLATGFAIGLGLLAKYAMAAFLGSMLLYALLSPQRGLKLRNPWFWGVMLLGLAHLIPNILWQAAHDFVTFAHTSDNANLGGSLFHPGKMFEFIGSQFGVFGPVIFGLLLYAVLWRFRALIKTPSYRFLLSFTVPLLAIMILQSLLSRANANWAAPVYVAASVMVASFCLKEDVVKQTSKLSVRWGQRLLFGSFCFHIVFMAFLYHWDPLRQTISFPLIANFDPYSRLRGWDVLGEEVAKRLKDHPDLTLLCLERMDIAAMRYYARPYADTAIKWQDRPGFADHFEMVTRLQDKIGQDFLLITRFKKFDSYAQRFAKTELLEPIKISIGKDHERIYQVAIMRDFQGYGRAE